MATMSVKGMTVVWPTVIIVEAVEAKEACHPNAEHNTTRNKENRVILSVIIKVSVIIRSGSIVQDEGNEVCYIADIHHVVAIHIGNEWIN